MESFSFTLEGNLSPRSLEGLLEDIRVSLKVEPTVEVVIAHEKSTAVSDRRVTIPGAHDFKDLYVLMHHLILMHHLTFWMGTEQVIEFSFSGEKK